MVNGRCESWDPVAPVAPFCPLPEMVMVPIHKYVCIYLYMYLYVSYLYRIYSVHVWGVSPL